MNPYLRIIRLLNCVMSSLAIILVGIVIEGFDIIALWLPTLLGILVVFFVTGGGNVINDYYDREVDLINHPERPIPSGEIVPKNALIYSSILFFLALIFAFFINICSLLIASYAIILLLLYESSLKKEGFVGNITISILVGMLFIFGGAIYGDFPLLIIFALMAFFANLGREVIKDIEDVSGDIDRKTLPKRIGKRKSGILASIFFYIAISLSPLPYFLFSFSIYYLIVVAISDIIFIYSSIIQFKDPEKGEKNAKIAMLVGLISYLVGGLT